MDQQKLITDHLFTLSRVILLCAFILLVGCSSGNDNGPIGNDFRSDGLSEDNQIIPGQWKLIWSDEFDGSVLDEAKWEYQTGTGRAGTGDGVTDDHGLDGWGNNEEQVYRSENISLQNGHLIINIKKEGEEFTSGRIRTKQDADNSFTFGRIEARIKLPSSEGLWSAFWMLGNDDSPYGIWPAKGEIDIMEFFDRAGPNFFNIGTLHYGMQGSRKQTPDGDKNFEFEAIPINIDPDSSACASSNQDNVCTDVVDGVNVNSVVDGKDPYDCLEYSVQTRNEEGALVNGECINKRYYCLLKNVDINASCPTEDPADDFHVYAIEWDENEIRWFVDGDHYQTVPAETYWTYGKSSGLTDQYNAGSTSAPFDTPHHILLNVAVGGNLPQQDVASTFLTDEMVVDWVRVYECAPNPDTGADCKGGRINGADDASINVIDPYRNFEYYQDNQLPFTRSYSLYTQGFDSLFGDTSSRMLGYKSEGISVTDNGDILQLDISESGGWLDIVDARDSYEPFTLNGMGSWNAISGWVNTGGAELIFDLKVASNPSGGDLFISMTSSEGKSESHKYHIDINNGSLAAGEWVEGISIPLNELISASLDTSEINSLIRFSAGGAVNFSIDNVKLVCGASASCRIKSQATNVLPVFGSEYTRAPGLSNSNETILDGDGNPLSDGKNSSIWNRDITAWDSIAGEDYTNRLSSNHVNWETSDLDPNSQDDIVDYILDARFNDNGANGVIFIGSTNGVDLSGYLDGSLVFDIRVLKNDANETIYFKVDHCSFQSDSDDCLKGGTGEIPVPLTLAAAPDSDWEQIKIPFCALTGLGLDDSSVVSPLVIVPGSDGRAQGVIIQLDNIYFDHRPSGVNCDTLLPLDFEQPNKIYPFKNFEGGSTLVVENPYPAGINSSATVAKMVKFSPPTPSKKYGGSYIELTDPLNFSEKGSLLSMKVLSLVPDLRFGLKLERAAGGSTSASLPEIIIEDPFEWIDVEFDFTGIATNQQSLRLITIIINDGVAGTGDDNSTLYFDDIAQSTSVLRTFDWTTDGLLLDFDNTSLVYPLGGWGGSVGTLIEDPTPGAVANNYVIQHDRDYQTITQWASGFIIGGNSGFDQAIPFIKPNFNNLAGSKTAFCLDVYSPYDQNHPFDFTSRSNIPVSLKVEDATDYQQSTGSTAYVSNTGWQTVVFDLTEGLQSALANSPGYVPASGDGTFEKVVINIEGDNLPSTLSYYFDNLELIGDENTDEVIDINDCGYSAL